MGGLVMTDPFHHYRRPVPIGEPMVIYPYLHVRAALLGGPLFCRLISFSYGYYKNVFLLLSFLLFCLLLIVCGDVESNPGPGSDKRVRVLYSNIRGLRADLDEFSVAGSDFDVLVCAESKLSDRRHLSELHILGFGCPE